MNPADLPHALRAPAHPGRPAPAELLAATRALAQGPLRAQAQAIDREGLYPRDLLQALAACGAMSAHLDSAEGPGDYGLAIQTMAEVSRVCGATGFMMWCQAVAGLYLQASGNPALTGALLQDHISGQRLGGTALSNPMKSYAAIEGLLLRASPVPGGYRVSGTLPWVSNLGPEHYCGAIAAIEDGAAAPAARELMFLLRCDAPGVTLRPCPAFSGMEGTGTYALRLDDVFVGPDDVIAEPARPLVARIRAGFVLLQCGMAVGITQGAIDSMRAVEDRLGHVNRYLDDRPEALQAELDALSTRALALAATPHEAGTAFFVEVLTLRAQGAELCLRAAQSALMHQGARGYLMNSEVQRRLREAQFVAIVTPALKHLRSEIARLSREAQPA